MINRSRATRHRMTQQTLRFFLTCCCKVLSLQRRTCSTTTASLAHVFSLCYATVYSSRIPAMVQTRSISSSTPSDSVRRVSDEVCRSLEKTLPTLARRRDETDVTAQCLGGAQKPTRLRLACGSDLTSDEQIQMDTWLRVTHVGGNVYDVDCAVEGGSSRRFTYCLPPQGNGSPLQMPDLGRRIGAFLLDELEQQVGRHRLRHP